ncbi:MAG: LysM peptidoglycan-binding domain-containing protein [Phycisphaerales bacterium]|nr:LysM peptidoglycan-binding domain-containing protein [Phycisphaerales bacterium]MCB9863644.1 LysM peptidoglycan-binding domain-containing protein [Phycisphaerales bacterium]
MTKETKVGLLVGLAFIILFAIILSEKGATNNVAPPSNLTIADAGQPGGGSLLPRNTVPLDNDGKLSIAKSLPPATDTRVAHTTGNSVIPERPVGVPIPKSQEEVQPLPKPIVDLLNYTPMAERQIALSDVGATPGAGSVLPNSLAKALTGDRPNETRLVIGPDPEESPIKSEIDSRPPQNTPPVAIAPVRIVANHKVQSGESLGKIAAKYYGRSTPSRIDAIFDVNRDRLTSKHAVRVGDVLRIPAIPDADGISFVNATEFNGKSIVEAQPRRDDEIRIPLSIDDKAASTPSREPESSPIEFKWYEVKENDTLSRIAARQMGSAGLFLKLFDFNRDLLPDKNSIKPGMKIRIPLIRTDEQISSADFTRARRDATQR